MRATIFALLVLRAAVLAAQSPTGLEAGIVGLFAAARPEVVGGGPSVAWRPGDRVRLVAAAIVGGQGGRTVGRGELSLDYLLEPARSHGVGVYGFAGIAGTTGARANGYLLLGVGAESAPGAAQGWLIEGGVGGGLRIAAGYRWRWLRREPRR